MASQRRRRKKSASSGNKMPPRHPDEGKSDTFALEALTVTSPLTDSPLSLDTAMALWLNGGKGVYLPDEEGSPYWLTGSFNGERDVVLTIEGLEQYTYMDDCV